MYQFTYVILIIHHVFIVTYVNYKTCFLVSYYLFRRRILLRVNECRLNGKSDFSLFAMLLKF